MIPTLRLGHVTGARICKRSGMKNAVFSVCARASQWWGKRDALRIARETILFVRGILSTKTNDANVAKFPSEYVRSRSWLSSFGGKFLRNPRENLEIERNVTRSYLSCTYRFMIMPGIPDSLFSFHHITVPLANLEMIFLYMEIFSKYNWVSK